MAEQKQKNIINSKQVSELLESDDELPDSYEDIPFTPAYENDSRFEPIRFPWLEHLIEQYPNTNKDEQLPIFQNVLNSISKPLNKGTFISKGTLSKRDLFIVRSIQDYVTDDIWLWFIEFLSQKFAQPHKTGCLVGSILDEHHAKTVNADFKTNKRSAYKLIIMTPE